MPLEPIPMTAPLTIRPATADDAELILRFITELAIYEKAEHEVKTDAAGIRDSLIRIAVGLEELDDLKADLALGLAAL